MRHALRSAPPRPLVGARTLVEQALSGGVSDTSLPSAAELLMLGTAASVIDEESLVAFLGTRGDIPRDIAGQLHGKIPAFGRHAGAALVASG